MPAADSGDDRAERAAAEREVEDDARIGLTASMPVRKTNSLKLAWSTGAILTETIFSWPGVGKWLIDAISRRDYPVVQGGILMIATLVILVNLVVDLLYGVLNPRIRHTR